MLLYSVSIPFLNLYTSKTPEAQPNSSSVLHEWTLLGNWIVGVLIVTHAFGLVHYCLTSGNPRKEASDKDEIDGVTTVLMHLYGLSYSLVFMNAVMWWSLLRDDFSSYYSISLNIVLVS